MKLHIFSFLVALPALATASNPCVDFFDEVGFHVKEPFQPIFLGAEDLTVSSISSSYLLTYCYPPDFRAPTPPALYDITLNRYANATLLQTQTGIWWKDVLYGGWMLPQFRFIARFLGEYLRGQTPLR